MRHNQVTTNSTPRGVLSAPGDLAVLRHAAGAARDHSNIPRVLVRGRNAAGAKAEAEARHARAAATRYMAY